ncbi:thiol:disulfide interchange protein TlpA [Mesorhizobium marinum]|uniref:thiol:disulfide interchange protein TlpA n=1 Tax=Mesorhizobium marinum TaxID=3228790 RepID=UPI00346582A9
MAEEKRSLFPALRLVLIAGIAGALAGAVAVYVTSRPAGNNGAVAPAASVSEADVAACAAKADRAASIAASARGDVAAMLAADPPQSLKALAFNDPEGKPMTLADRAGKTVLLNLWATWCFPCREEMPALDALQRDAGGDAFEVIAVNVDTGDDAKPKKFLADTGIDTLGYYRDNTLSLFNDLKKRGLALGLPVTLLIDAEGCLLAHMNGPAHWSGDDAKALVGAATAKP